jgi:hypothetical protein
MLVVAILALVIVVGLTLLQRRASADPAPRRAAPAPPPPSEPPPAGLPRGPSRVKNDLQLDDPILGVLTFNDNALWEGDSFEFDGIPVLLELSGDAHGPYASVRALVQAAIAQPDLHARGRDIVRAELVTRGVDTDDVEAYEIAVDSSETGAVIGFVWYNVETFDGEIGVSSTDGWRTLTLEVVE